MKPERFILAIDHGTSGIKAAIVSTKGRVVDFDMERTPTHFSPGGGAEQDPEVWWEALVSVCKRLVARVAEHRDDIVAMAVSSTWSTTVAVDRDGRHLMNALTWMDSRGARYVERVMKGFPKIAGYGLSNLLRWVPKTGGGPSLSGKDDIAHALLIKNEYPEVYAKTHAFLPSKDYLNLRLTGEIAASYDSIMLFWVTDIRDINRVRYDNDLIRRLGLDRAKLPPLKASTDVLGDLLTDVANQIGLPRNVKVVVGSPDHQSACIGSGAVRDFEGHIYIGTSSWVQCIVPFKKTDVLHSIASLPTAIAGRYQAINEQDVAGGCLDFLIHNIVFHKNRLLQGDPPENPYRYLDDIAEGVPAGSHQLIVTPWLNGERSPVDDPSLRGGLFNVSMTTTQDDIVRAFLEGVAYNTRWNLTYVERFIKRKLDPINIVGGGAKSDVWCQVFADVMNREIRQVVDPMQANARGAALIASVGLGDIVFDEIPELVEVQNTFTPNPKHRSLYDRLFKEFVGIYRNNRAMYRRLNG